jgi:hypothetical protein
MADPLTTSPLDAMAHLYNDPMPIPSPAHAAQPQPQPAAQPVLPPDFQLPHNPNFERELEAQRAMDAGTKGGTIPQPKAATQSPQEPNKPATTPEPQEREDQSSWKAPRKAKDWQALKDDFAKREASYRAEIEALRGGKPATTPSTSAEPVSGEFDISKLPIEKLAAHPEIAKRLKERDEYLDIVKQTHVERDPEFVAKFEPRKEAAIRAAKAVAGGAANDLAKLLAEPASEIRDERIAKLTENFSESSKRMVSAALHNLAAIDVEREGEIAARKATFEARQLDQFKQHEAKQRERQAKLDSAFDRQLAYWSDPKEGMPFFVKKGDPKWDAEVDATVAAARDIFNGALSPEQLSDYAKWAAVAKRIFSEREELLTELQRFRDADVRWRAGTPSDVGMPGSFVETSRGPAPYNPSDPFSGSRSFVEGLEAARHSDSVRR